MLLATEAQNLCFLGRGIDFFLADTAFMHQACVRCPHRKVASFAYFQAKIDVVIGHLEVDFVEAADFLVDRTADHHAGCGDGRIVLVDLKPLHIAWRVRLGMDKWMIGRAAQAEHDAAVLDAAVRVVQLGADDAYFRTLSVVEQGVDPVFVQNGCIVIEQDQVLAAGLRNCKIVDRRIVERVRIAQHADLLAAQLGDAIQVGASGRLLAVVVDDQQFVACVPGALDQAVDQAVKHRQLIACGHDDRYQRLLLMQVTHPIDAGQAAGMQFVGHAQAFKMSLHDSRRLFRHGRLGQP